MQLVLNIMSLFSLYLILTLSFSIIFQTAKFFHFAHAAIITLSPYIFFMFLSLNISILVSLLFAFMIIILIVIFIESFVYKKLRSKKSSSLLLLIVSIGIYIIIQNFISLIWGDDTILFNLGLVRVGYSFIGGYIAIIQIKSILISIIILMSYFIFFKYSIIGRQIQAVSSNIELANVFGINSNKIILISFCIGSLIAAICGILIAFDTGANPTMGFSLLIYGVVAMIIGGVGSTWGLIGGALLLATAQHLGAYYIDSKWMDAIAYIILILFLIWKPLGFSGQRLKKININ